MVARNNCNGNIVDNRAATLEPERRLTGDRLRMLLPIRAHRLPWSTGARHGESYEN